MQDFLQQIESKLAEKRQFAVAVVTKTWGSAPRPIGSMLFVADDDTLFGSVSGGCVEGQVAKIAQEVIETQAARLLSFGVSDDDAWSVGLSCGGNIDVLIVPFFSENIKSTILQSTAKNQGGVWLTPLSSGHNSHAFWQPQGGFLTENTVFEPEISDFLKKEAQRAFNERTSKSIELPDGSAWFLTVFPPKMRLVIVGATHVAAELIHLAQGFDFETFVIDPRGFFAQNTHFKTAPDHIFEEWSAEILPHIPLDAYTFTVLLTHDPKIDDQALALLLPSDVAYIGALGSRKTHEKRVERLKKAGYTEGVTAKIHAPIGVAIKAKTAGEIALSILAEIVGVKNRFG